MSNDPFGVCLKPKCDEEELPKDLPSFTDMAKGLFGSAKDIVAGALHGEGVMVSEDVYLQRMSICNTCEFFRNEDKRCTQCGCFMETKTRFKKAYCPVEKWKDV